MSVLIVGSVALDTVRTPWGEIKDGLGGSAVHGALAASLFSSVRLVGVVGADFPRKHIDLLKRREIDLEGLEIVKGGQTFRWGGTYFDDINRRETNFTHLNVFETFRPRVSEEARRSPFVFLANIDPELQLQVLEQCRRPRLTLLDTMNLWIDIRRDALEEVIRRSDIVLMNDEEARQFSGMLSLERAARKILENGCRRVIVKKGEHGALMFSKTGFFAAPGIPLPKVVDPTGAGDTFAGGFIGYLARKGTATEATLRQAILVGTALASFCVEDFSVRRVASLKKEDLRRRLRALSGAVRCAAPKI